MNATPTYRLFVEVQWIGDARVLRQQTFVRRNAEHADYDAAVAMLGDWQAGKPVVQVEPAVAELLQRAIKFRLEALYNEKASMEAEIAALERRKI